MQRQYIPITIIVRGMLQGVTDVKPVLYNVSKSLDIYGAAKEPVEVIIPNQELAPESSDGYYRFAAVLLRQQSAYDASMELRFKSDGREVTAGYPFGKMLYEAGEDISLGNQKPVVMDIVIGGGSIYLTISVAEWKRHTTLDITY